MDQEAYNSWALVFQVVMAIGAGIFSFFQWKINQRLKDLQDFVAISIIPLPIGGLNITNVGKSNLYIKRWEIGQIHENFDRSILLPSVNGINITIATPSEPGEYPVRLYLFDEQKEKYISEGKFFVDVVQINPPLTQVNLGMDGTSGVTQQPSMPTIGTRSRAYSFDTRKHSWTL